MIYDFIYIVNELTIFNGYCTIMIGNKREDEV
jgi:hypothetical protein